MIVLAKTPLKKLSSQTKHSPQNSVLNILTSSHSTNKATSSTPANMSPAAVPIALEPLPWKGFGATLYVSEKVNCHADCFTADNGPTDVIAGVGMGLSVSVE
jgi:hypothetical protein